METLDFGVLGIRTLSDLLRLCDHEEERRQRWRRKTESGTPLHGWRLKTMCSDTQYYIATSTVCTLQIIH